jgi:hypothetical protein
MRGRPNLPIGDAYPTSLTAPWSRCHLDVPQDTSVAEGSSNYSFPMTTSSLRPKDTRDALKVCLEPGHREALEQYRRKEGLRSLAHAIRHLMDRGLAET